MSLTARTKDGLKIYAFEFESAIDLYQKYPKGDLFSPYPDVDASVFYRHRNGYIPHFVHASNAAKTSYNHHPVSVEHEYGKYVLAAYFCRLYPECEVTFEEPFSEIKRVADVCVHLPGGYKIIGECQLAGITAADLCQRTEDYYSLSMDVRWLLGKSAKTQQNQDWCVENIGEVWHFDPKTEAVQGVRDISSIVSGVKLHRSSSVGYRLSNDDGVKESA